jgi:hypothetical protein
MLVYKDNLQVKTTAKADWLLGSHPTVLNARDLEDSLALLPEMSGLPIEIRMEWISLDKGDKLRIKAAHILCAWESTLFCRRALNKIYGKKRGKQFGATIRLSATTRRAIPTLYGVLPTV